MQGRTVAESRVIMTHLMLPEDANPAGNVHGGVILKHIDNAAAVAAWRHARGNAVTASFDRVDFLQPVYVGEVCTFKASINLVGKSSMEVGVRVEAENMFTGDIRWTASAYVTYVALDEKHRPKEIAPLILENDDDRRRNREAMMRRENRLALKQRERESQDSQQDSEQGGA